MNPNQNTGLKNKNSASLNSRSIDETQPSFDDFLDVAKNNLNVYQCAANITLDDDAIDEIIDTLKIVYKAKLLLYQSKNILFDNHLNQQFVKYLFDEIDKYIDSKMASETGNAPDQR